MDYKIADRLIELRKKHAYSQEELAEKLDISRQAISKWERAESLPDTENLIALSRLYHITLDELVHGHQDNMVGVIQEQASHTTTHRTAHNGKNQELLNIVLAILGFAAAITCLALIGYFISEIVEVVGGYYDHMGEAHVRSELIGYSIALVFCVLGLVLGIVLSVASYRRYKRCKQKHLIGQ